MDRREFAETIRALETLSSAHMGWYRNEPSGRYKPKIVEFMPTYARGLRTEYGIAMEVAQDGQSWIPGFLEEVTREDARAACVAMAAISERLLDALRFR